jgi:hypothetical protein
MGKFELTIGPDGVSGIQASACVYEPQGPLFGRSGRQMIVGPGHARAGTQIARFGTTPGGYLGG